MKATTHSLTSLTQLFVHILAQPPDLDIEPSTPQPCISVIYSSHINQDPSPPFAMASEQILSGTDSAAIAGTCEAHGITTTEFAELQRRATAAKATAYCPYSQFRVGATLLSKTKGQGEEYISGANVENASYPVGTCAERVALGKAVTEGHRGFRAVAVATDISPPASPCGMCRQL